VDVSAGFARKEPLMKAAVLYEVNKPLVIEEIDIDEPGPDQVMVKTVSAGICHSDLHQIEGRWPINVPVVLGHEGAGIVERVGEGVTYVQPGDHVVMNFKPFCGTCRFCQSGRPVLCTQASSDAKHLHKGGQPIDDFLSVSSFAERMLAPESGVVKVRDDAPLDKLSIMGCAVATGVGAVVNTAKVEAGSSVAVIGIGGVGLSVIQGAALVGAYPIIAIDLLERKLGMAREFGATHFVNASEKNPVEAVVALTDGGADYAFEVIGSPEAISQAVDMVHPGGQAIMVGVSPFGSKTSIDTRKLLEERTIRGCVYGSIRPRVDIPRYIDLYMAGRLKLDQMVTRSFPLEGINEAFAAMKAGEVARSVIVF
jgi:S-(hydroxymethyl)glutathione dehydrogenase/alcohol dehydrogenase